MVRLHGRGDPAGIDRLFGRRPLSEWLDQPAYRISADRCSRTQFVSKTAQPDKLAHVLPGAAHECGCDSAVQAGRRVTGLGRFVAEGFHQPADAVSGRGGSEKGRDRQILGKCPRADSVNRTRRGRSIFNYFLEKPVIVFR